ncbi:DUF3106 domain-containing protein [Luteimonas vadosa]|uniref:DUF3106 domain-containing protein n=1 Tax=Luteimonas vadosa TaxID=1165507 RepID=A0ABP9DPS7_9GAMM
MRRASHPLPVILAAAALLACAVAWSQGLPPSLRDSVDAMPPAQRQQVLARQARLDALPAAERLRVRRRLSEWDALDREQQRARRDAWLSWRALPTLEQALLRAAANRYAALPAAEQRAWRERYAALDAIERRGWALGPTLGAVYPQLYPLLAQVPQDERDKLLATLRSMGAGEHADLAVLAQRTPPQERDALRRELLSTDASQREAWLRRRVDP